MVKKCRFKSSLTESDSNMSGHIGSLSPEQQQQLDNIKAKVDSTLTEPELIDIKNKVVTDYVYLRFLRARQFDLEKSYDMLYNMLKFRRDFQGIAVAGVNPATCVHEIQSGKGFFHGYDKQDRPVTYVLPRLHDPAITDPLENQRFTILQMEYGRAIMTPPCETATIVFDMTGVALKNIDMQSTKFMVNTFANYYPETLGQVLIYDAPWIVNGAWKVIKPWLDPVTASKVIFIAKGTLPQYINEDNLPVEYGGKDPFKYDHEKYRAILEREIPSP
jgi:hypothetical protein